VEMRRTKLSSNISACNISHNNVANKASTLESILDLYEVSVLYITELLMK